MAKALSSICFATLLVVVLLISAEIPKSEATLYCKKYLGEVVMPYKCKESECKSQCSLVFPESCRGDCDNHPDRVGLQHDHDEHCFCYGH